MTSHPTKTTSWLVVIEYSTPSSTFVMLPRCNHPSGSSPYPLGNDSPPSTTHLSGSQNASPPCISSVKSSHLTSSDTKTAIESPFPSLIWIKLTVSPWLFSKYTSSVGLHLSASPMEPAPRIITKIPMTIPIAPRPRVTFVPLFINNIRIK